MASEKETCSDLPVFIYGTLKKGYPNSRYMPLSAAYMGNACTVDPWPLVVDTGMGIPYLIQIPNHPNAKTVKGELYKVDEAALHTLDKFEGLDTGFYVREELKVCYSSALIQSENSGLRTPMVVQNEVVTASAYFRSPANGGPAWARKWTVDTLLKLPMVKSYSEHHAQTFIPRTDRYT